VELEVQPPAEARRFIDFATSHGCHCRSVGGEHRLQLSVPQARDPTEARRMALDLITSFSEVQKGADVRIVGYD
jgi:hypothetical protein